MSERRKRASRAAAIKRLLPVSAASLLLVSCGNLSSLFGPGDTRQTASIPVAVVPPPPPVSWPTHGWPTSTPETQGIDSNVLADAMDTIRARHIPVHSL